MAPKQTVKVGPFARPPAATKPAAAKQPGTSAAFPPGSPKKPPVTAKGRI
jgi:hypothetical protein